MVLEMNLHSKALKRNTEINIILPGGDAETSSFDKVLWLFHGLSGDHTDWIRKTSIELYARAHRVAVVMPDVGRSWYTDTAYGEHYFSYVTQELPELCANTFKGFCQDRDCNIIGGLSMGGYGAIKAALTYPERYSAAFALSGALDIARVGRAHDLEEWKGIFGFDLKSATELSGSENDLFALAEKDAKTGVALPKLYFWCGTEDALIDSNRLFSQHLSQLGIDHRFDQSVGDHSWEWWDQHVQSALKYLVNGNS